MARTYLISGRRGASYTEVVTAVSILLVVGIGTIFAYAPVRERSRAKRDQQNLELLNKAAMAYSQETGNWPDRALIKLYEAGYTKSRTTMTPYGGYYQWDSTHQRVISPLAPENLNYD